MTREEAKEMFRSDKDAYGKPKHIMKNIDKIYDDFEKEQSESQKSAIPCVIMRDLYGELREMGIPAGYADKVAGWAKTL